MKKNFRRLKSLALGICLSAVSTLASFGQGFGQGWAYGFVDITSQLATPIVTAASTSNAIPSIVIDASKEKDVAFQAQFCFSGATTSNAVYVLQRSLDKVNWETTGFTWTIAGNGTNYITAVTNLAGANFGGAPGYWRVQSLQNTHGSLVLTNLQFGYAVKRGAP